MKLEQCSLLALGYQILKQCNQSVMDGTVQNREPNTPGLSLPQLYRQSETEVPDTHHGKFSLKMQ